MSWSAPRYRRTLKSNLPCRIWRVVPLLESLFGFAPPANLVAASAGKMRKTLHLYLVKPSQYDDDGYVVRHFRGVLPSNTLACLAGLTEDVVRQKRLGDSWNIKVHLFDETV